MKRWLTAILSIGLILSFAVPVWAAAAPGLVGYYRLEGNANDSSGNGNNGTLGAGAAEPTLTTGQSGQAYSFDAGDRITLSTGAQWELQSFTLIAKVSVTASAVNKPIFDVGAFEIDWHIDANGPMEILCTDLTPDRKTGSADQEDDTFRNVAITKDGTAVILLVNGASDGTETMAGAITFGNNTAYIGYDTAGGFLGILDEVLIYSRVLPEGEIRQVSMGFLHGGM